ncbi:hypothetical protein [Dyella sp.]|uniref:hypothetical protein n=1 Tax=Dyella sp. TaxID=1869338 RepID=UPI00284A8153|nr:hypothetical protein [Dyella sp.]MDR3446024.1 hypothetical protein [Dyella sp.]
MSSAKRLTKIEVPFDFLTATDVCYHYGEYASDGRGYKASETNQWISNLKKKPSAPSGQLHYKAKAIEYWAQILRELMPHANCQNLTYVPMPGSKPVGHPDYDPRLQDVLKRYALGSQGIDIRPVLRQATARSAQHESGGRLTPDQLAQGMEVDTSQLTTPLRPLVIVFDDVLTMGATYKAAQSLLLPLPGVKVVRGVFLARTVWPNPFAGVDLSEFIASMNASE